MTRPRPAPVRVEEDVDLVGAAIVRLARVEVPVSSAANVARAAGRLDGTAATKEAGEPAVRRRCAGEHRVERTPVSWAAAQAIGQRH